MPRKRSPEGLLSLLKGESNSVFTVHILWFLLKVLRVVAPSKLIPKSRTLSTFIGRFVYCEMDCQLLFLIKPFQKEKETRRSRGLMGRTKSRSWPSWANSATSRRKPQKTDCLGRRRREKVPGKVQEKVQRTLDSTYYWVSWFCWDSIVILCRRDGFEGAFLRHFVFLCVPKWRAQQCEIRRLHMNKITFKITIIKSGSIIFSGRLLIKRDH